jgi:hypothetical protein
MKKGRKKVNRLRIAIYTGIPCGERRKPATRKSSVTVKIVRIALNLPVTVLHCLTGRV